MCAHGLWKVVVSGQLAQVTLLGSRTSTVHLIMVLLRASVAHYPSFARTCVVHRLIFVRTLVVHRHRCNRTGLVHCLITTVGMIIATIVIQVLTYRPSS